MNVSTPPLQGKTALVTGAGGTMGRAVVRALIDLNAASLAPLVAEYNGRVHAVTCNIADPAQVQAAHAAVLEAIGPVDVLVNNAGILSNNKLAATSTEEWRRVMGANLDGALFWAQAVVPSLLARAELQTARERGAVQDHARAGDLARIAHDARREMAGALALDASVLLRNGSCLHVGLVADCEDGECPPGA